METDALYRDPDDARFVGDPWPVFNRIRQEAPLYYNQPHDFYALSRYADVERAVTDTETFSSSRGVILELIKADIEMPPGTLIMEDPPVHDIHRKLLARVFSPRRIAELEPKVREYCARCLDPLVGESRFDLIEKLGLEMPMRVIGMLLGIPEEGQAAFREQSDAHLISDDGRLDTSQGAILTFDAFGEYIDWRLTHPSDDVITELPTARFEDENGVTRTLTRDEVLMYVTVLAGAGNETTGLLIGWMGSTLARHPEQRAEIVADPALIPGAVEEVLRLEPPGPSIARHADQAGGVPRSGCPRGQRDAAVRRRRQPRPGAVRRPRPVRHPPQEEPAPDVQHRPALLPRLRSRPPRGPHRPGGDRGAVAGGGSGLGRGQDAADLVRAGMGAAAAPGRIEVGPMPGRAEGKVAFITGAARGQG